VTSKERVLAALRRGEVDYVPCSLTFFDPASARGYAWQLPWTRSASAREVLEYRVRRLGTDPVVFFRPARQYPRPEVTSRSWETAGVIHKVWATPSGEMHAAVRRDETWPFGADIPLYSDHVGHFVEPWLESEADLACLGHMVLPASGAGDLERIREGHARSRALADEYGLALGADVGSGLTGAMQLAGAEALCLMTAERPALVDEYLALEHAQTMRHLELSSDLGVDFVVRNGFYETADFYGPATLERFLGARLRREIEAAHSAGVLALYLVHTGVMPILDYLDSLGFDGLWKIDPAFHGVDLRAMEGKLGQEKSFWLGPSGAYHLWSRDPEDVRRAVRRIFQAFGRRGLVLGASPSVHSIMPWQNTLALVDEWQKLRS
jgi:uroporphyrinogen-III decarboxylase